MSNFTVNAVLKVSGCSNDPKGYVWLYRNYYYDTYSLYSDELYALTNHNKVARRPSTQLPPECDWKCDSCSCQNSLTTVNNRNTLLVFTPIKAVFRSTSIKKFQQQQSIKRAFAQNKNIAVCLAEKSVSSKTTRPNIIVESIFIYVSWLSLFLFLHFLVLMKLVGTKTILFTTLTYKNTGYPLLR